MKRRPARKWKNSVRKMYAKALIDRVIEFTEKGIGEEQCGFRENERFSDQTFVERN